MEQKEFIFKTTPDLAIGLLTILTETMKTKLTPTVLDLYVQLKAQIVNKLGENYEERRSN